MAMCWEEHTRFTVSEKDMAQSYHLVTEGDLSLMVQHEIVEGGPTTAFIMPSYQVERGYKGELFSVQFAIVDNDAAAWEWFDEMKVSRPWEVRH